MKFFPRFAAGLFGLSMMMSCNGPEDDNYGTVRIEVSPLGGDLTILAGTTEVTATVTYLACLEDFYLTRKPGERQDGVEGADVFAEWEARLCAEFEDTPPCEVTGIEQTLDEATQNYRLKITYRITDNDPASIAYREFNVGPLPIDEFAGCSSGGPKVRLDVGGLIGRNSAGDQIWHITTLPSPNEANTNQGAPLRVEVIAD